MRKSLIGILCVLTASAQARERGEDDLRRDMEFAKTQVYPALVNISVVAKQFVGGRSVRSPAAGSGVIVSPAGHVVTNYHVAGDTTRIVCRLPTKESIEAEVVAHDPLTDLTVLRLKLETRRERNAPIPFARIGDSDQLRVGDYVLAMGNPMTLSSSMTLGIVSNPKRVFASFTGAEMEQMDLGEGQVTGLFTRWVQHDALILPGNSGGPLVNLRGEVVGINELGGGGVAFAIPSNLVAHVLNQALAFREVRRGWFGVSLYPVEKMGLDAGVLVSSVQPQGPAERAGIRPGDVLLSVDGKPCDAVHFEEIPILYKRFADFAAGEKVAVALQRAGQREEVELAVVRMEQYLADAHEVRTLGIVVRDITGPMALVRRYPDSNGVLVGSVRPGYPADSAKPPVARGDVIVELDGKAVKDYATLVEIVKGIAGKERTPIRLRRVAEDIVTVLDTSKKKPEFAGGELPKAWIGVRTQVVTVDVAKALGIADGVRGLRVTQVHDGTEAAKAGLKVGDILTALNGEALDAHRVQDAEMLTRRVELLSIGEDAALTVLRGGETTEVKVLLEETPRTAAEVKAREDALLEYKARAITFADRVDRRWPADQQGVLVTQVTRGGWAALAGLRVGDLILRIENEPVRNIRDFRKAVRSIATQQPRIARIFVIRGYRTAFVFVEPEYPSGK